jgi:cysteine desulfurase family protein (TIGR01976 family)
MKLDTDFVRNQFPALTKGRHKHVAFFENAGGTFVPKQVIEHLDKFMIESKVQPYAPYPMSEMATDAIEQSTVKMAEMINANTSEIVIGHCTTMNLYILSMALVSWLKPGDEIIVTNQDHESNISPWLRLKKNGVIIKEWCVQEETGELLIDDLSVLLSNKTKLVCMPHSSNIIGSVNDVKQVADLVHEKNALLLVDGVSYAPHHAVDVKVLGVDIYVLSLYKVFGPHLGLMYVKESHHDKLDNQSLEFMPELYAGINRTGAPNYLRIALNPGLVNHEEVASLNGLVEYFESLHLHHFNNQAATFFECIKNIFELIVQHESELAECFLKNIETNSSIQLIGRINANLNKRSPTYCLQIKNDKTPKENTVLLAEKNIAIQSGSFYAWRCLQAIGIDPATGPLRVSMAHFNTIDEVERLNSAINSL